MCDRILNLSWCIWSGTESLLTLPTPRRPEAQQSLNGGWGMETRQRVIAEPGAGRKPCWASPAACDEPRPEHTERAGGGRLGSEETPGTGQSVSPGRPRGKMNVPHGPLIAFATHKPASGQSRLGKSTNMAKLCKNTFCSFNYELCNIAFRRITFSL